jgi:hypothetical protein
VARMGDRKGVYRVLVGRPERKRHLGDLRVGGSIILKWIYKNGLGRHGLDCTGSV